MTWAIEFSAAPCLPTLPEDCQPNPGVYGFELALWLAEAGYAGRPRDYTVSIRKRRSLEQRLHRVADHAALDDLGRQIVELLRAKRIEVLRAQAAT